ncbi:MAG: PepSY domain-containing protein [Pseudomonadota bacterium]
MKMDAAIKARRIRTPPILWRRIHKWVGLILGIQFVLWTVSGAIMALLDSDKVGGHSSPAIEVAAPWPRGLLDPSTLGSAESLILRRLDDRAVYEVADASRVQLLDARTGKPVTIDPITAERVARKAFHQTAPLVSVERLERPNLEAREYEGPMWRVNFADAENSSSYVSAVTGRALVNRGDTWRTWDFVWMLHNMDYVNRTSFNHPLIIFVAFGTLWLSFTGFYLLFKSFRRREFNWLLGRR